MQPIKPGDDCLPQIISNYIVIFLTMEQLFGYDTSRKSIL